jgi:hypothetical protein
MLNKQVETVTRASQLYKKYEKLLQPHPLSYDCREP